MRLARLNVLQLRLRSFVGDFVREWDKMTAVLMTLDEC